MLQKFACALALIFLGSIAVAETITGRITEATDKHVTIVTGKKADKKSHKIHVTADTKYYQGRGKKKKDDSTLKDLQEAIEKGGKRGVNGTVEFEVKDKKEIATEVSFRRGKKKKGAD